MNFKNHYKKIGKILVQILLPIFTISAQIMIAFKHSEIGLILNLLAQPFWLYSSWKSWKQAEQIGLFITTVIFTIITAIGIINYRFLG